MFFSTKTKSRANISDILIQTYLKNSKLRKLQLGCGENMITGWLNSDLNEGDNRISLDVTAHFPLPSASFKYIYSEHLIEHVSFEDGQKMLKECFRIMKKGARIRIATPNLSFLVDIYNHQQDPLNRRYLRWAIKNFSPYASRNHPGFLINNFVRAWGHQFIYDKSTLSLALRQVGFSNIKNCQLFKSVDPVFSNLEFHAKDLGNEFYSLETLILEAVKK